MAARVAERAPVLASGRAGDALEALSALLLPGPWAEARPPTATEFKATSIPKMPRDEASVKVRTGPPQDDEADHDWPVWAGVIPLGITAGDPVPDPRLGPGLEPPALSVTASVRPEHGRNSL
jgi:hypothetical protein